MFCINCGASNRDDAISCINCGDSLSEGFTGKELSWLKRFLNDVSTLKKIDFLRGLFCLSSTRAFSLKIMNFLYGLSILGAGLVAFFFVIAGFNISKWLGFIVLFLIAPLTFFLTVIYTRVFLETTLMFSRMADHIAERPVDVGRPDTEENQESKNSIQWNV